MTDDLLSGFHAELHGKDPRGLLLLMDSTNKCNLRCVMCHFSREDARLEPFVGWDEGLLAKLRDQVLPLTRRTVLSVASEPLMWKSFPALLETMREARVPLIEMITNATLMTDELADRIVASGVTGVSISIEGGTAQTYESIRRPAKFSRFLEGVRALVRARERAGTGTPRLQFNVVLLRRSIGELPDVLRLAASLGVDDIDLRHVIQIDELGMEAETMLGDKRRSNAALAEARRLAAELGLRILCDPGDFVIDEDEPAPAAPVPPPPPRAEDTTAPLASKPTGPPPPAPRYGAGLPPIDGSRPLEKPAKVACDAPWRQFNVRPDGSVTPCCFWYTADRLGDLRRESFAEIWEGDAYRRLRHEILTGDLGPNCARCPVRGIGDVQDEDAHKAHDRAKGRQGTPVAAS